jgi:hypothetical protein
VKDFLARIAEVFQQIAAVIGKAAPMAKKVPTVISRVTPGILHFETRIEITDARIPGKKSPTSAPTTVDAIGFETVPVETRCPR